MILDKELQFSDSVALVASANSSVISLGAASHLFEGESMAIHINVEVSADFADTDETYSFGVETDDNVGMGSPTNILERAILATELVAGSRHTLMVPIEKNQEGFMRLAYTLAGTTPSVTLSAYLVPTSFVGNTHDYPNNSLIS